MTKILFAVTACVLAVVGTAVSDAAEIKVLAAAPFKAALTEEFLPKFERETGSKVSVKFDLAASLKPQIEAGEPFDVAILTPTIIDDLIKSGKIDTKSRSIIARIGAGIAIRQGASKPDISTTEAFKRVLQGAKSIAYGDPAKGGAVPVYFVTLLQRLGIAEEAKAKTKLVAPGETPQAVATGEAELGIVQASELVSVRGVELLGPFPTELQLYTILAAGIASNSKEPEAASALIKLLTAPAAASVLKAKGMEPGEPFVLRHGGGGRTSAARSV